jgi:hypothetical protein
MFQGEEKEEKEEERNVPWCFYVVFYNSTLTHIHAQHVCIKKKEEKPTHKVPCRYTYLNNVL